MADIDLSGLLKKLTDDYETGKAEQRRRFTAGVSGLSGVADTFKPGGEFTKKTTAAALKAAKSAFVGVGGPSPTAVSKPFASAIKRMRVGSEAGALSNRAQFQKMFPNIFPGPSALANLGVGGYNTLTRALQAKSWAGPLADPNTGVSGIAPAAGMGSSADGSNIKYMLNASGKMVPYISNF